MKLDYEFKLGDYVVCDNLRDEQVQSIIERMVECGANRVEELENSNSLCSVLSWDRDGDTYFNEESTFSGNAEYTEVKWEDIVKGQTVGKGRPLNKEDYTHSKPSLGGFSVGQLVDELKMKSINRPDVLVSDGSAELSACGISINVSACSAEDITRYYDALTVLKEIV